VLKLTSSYILTWFIELMEKIHKTELYFYQKLGELFYAISASDQLVKEEEYKALVQIVEKNGKAKATTIMNSIPMLLIKFPSCLTGLIMSVWILKSVIKIL